MIFSKVIEYIPLYDLIVPFLSMDYHYAYFAVSLLGEVFGWPEQLVMQLLLTFDSPHALLMHNFVNPYLCYSKQELASHEVSWLADAQTRCSMLQHVLWALANMFADLNIANIAISTPSITSGSATVQTLLDVAETIVRTESVYASKLFIDCSLALTNLLTTCSVEKLELIVTSKV
jgi:hypothetical protein